MAAAPLSVAVVGGGIIGSATAYYLSQKGARPVVLEAIGPACSASGKAGGFLALDWCDSSPVGPLARRSFALHAALAQELGADCGYRRVTTHSLSVKAGQIAGALHWRCGAAHGPCGCGTYRQSHHAGRGSRTLPCCRHPQAGASWRACLTG